MPVRVIKHKMGIYPISMLEINKRSHCRNRPANPKRVAYSLDDQHIGKCMKQKKKLFFDGRADGKKHRPPHIHFLVVVRNGSHCKLFDL